MPVRKPGVGGGADMVELVIRLKVPRGVKNDRLVNAVHEAFALLHGQEQPDVKVAGVVVRDREKLP